MRRRAAAGAHRIAGEAARTRIHRPDQHEPGGEDDRPRRTGDDHRAFLERLAQHLEDVPAEFEHFIEKEHAVMGEAHLAGAWMRSAAGKRGV